MNKVLEEARRHIDLKRRENENAALTRKTKALEDEKFNTLYKERMAELQRQIQNGLKIDLKKYDAALESRLKELKIETIEPKYDCPLCHDRGYVDGKICVCLKKELTSLLIAQSGFHSLEKFSTARFDIFEDKEKMKKIYDLMQKWCNSNFKKNIIFISGGTGAGKTHLTKCMANELIERGLYVNLTTTFAMNEAFLKAYSTRNQEEKEGIISPYLESEVLFIDDLGTEPRRKDVTNVYLYLILNERKMANKVTVITSNLDLKDLQENYDERISSRIMDKDTSICIRIDEKDLRLKKK